MKFASLKGKARSLIALLLVTMFGLSATGFAEVGKSGWMIFKKAQGVNTRGVTSVSSEFGSLPGMLYNPALLGSRTTREAFFMTESGFAGDKLGGLLYGQPLKNGMIAGGLIGYDAGTIELNWMENGALKTQNANAQRDLLGIVSYGYRAKSDLLVGGSLKLATSQLAERSSANAFAADVGVMYMPKEHLALSAAIQNIGISTKFVEKANPLPLSAYFGANYAVKIKDYHLLPGIGVTYNAVDGTIAPEIGMELRYNVISMSVGYKFDRTESALQLGLGINWKNIEFSYAYVPGIYLDTTHRLNVSYKFTDPFAKKAGDKETKASAPVADSKLSLTPAPEAKPAAKPAAKTAVKTTRTVKTTVSTTKKVN